MVYIIIIACAALGAQVAKRLLRDPALPKAESKLRAQGLLELGRIFQAAKAPAHVKKDADAQMEEALQKIQDLYMGGAEGPDSTDGREEPATAAAGAAKS